MHLVCHLRVANSMEGLFEELVRLKVHSVPVSDEGVPGVPVQQELRGTAGVQPASRCYHYNHHHGLPAGGQLHLHRQQRGGWVTAGTVCLVRDWGQERQGTVSERQDGVVDIIHIITTLCSTFSNSRYRCPSRRWCHDSSSSRPIWPQPQGQDIIQVRTFSSFSFLSLLSPSSFCLCLSHCHYPKNEWQLLKCIQKVFRHPRFIPDCYVTALF